MYWSNVDQVFNCIDHPLLKYWLCIDYLLHKCYVYVIIFQPVSRIERCRVNINYVLIEYWSDMDEIMIKYLNELIMFCLSINHVLIMYLSDMHQVFHCIDHLLLKYWWCIDYVLLKSSLSIDYVLTKYWLDIDHILTKYLNVLIILCLNTDYLLLMNWLCIDTILIVALIRI